MEAGKEPPSESLKLLEPMGLFWTVRRKSKKIPLNVRIYCHLLTLALSLGDPYEPFGHPHNARSDSASNAAAAGLPVQHNLHDRISDTLMY